MATDPTRQAEREIDRLEEELAQTDDPEERRWLQREMREIGREIAEYDRWETEGRERGWP